VSEPAISAAGDRSVAARDIRDSIIVTGDNVRIEVGAGGIGGTLLDHLGLRPRIRKRARPKPLDVRDEPFADRIDRESEVQSLAEMSGPGPVTVTGEALVGKTYVLRAALAAWTAPAQDGIVCRYGKGRSLEDLLQELWDAVYETKPPTYPGTSELSRDLAELEALVVVDAAELDHADAQRLAALVPKSQLVLVSGERQLWDGSELVVAGLPAEDALALLERDLGRALSPEERSAATALSAALNGHPQRLRQAASAIRRGTYSLIGDMPSPADVAGAVLETALGSTDERERAVLAVLAQFHGLQVSEELLEALAGAGAGEVAAALVKAGLATAHSPSYAAAVALEGKLSAAELDAAYGRAVEHLSFPEDNRLTGDDLQAGLALMQTAARLGRARDVIRLGRALVPALVLARSFGGWREAVGLVRHAAGEVNDRGAEGWALHEAGSRSLCLGEVETGRGLLRRGLKVREEAGDVVGCAATRHNLRLPGRPPWYLRRIAHLPVLVLIGLIGILGFAGGGGAVAWMVTHDGGKSATETVVVDVVPDGSGSVHSESGDIECPVTCTAVLAHGASLRLLPAAARGFEFAGWSDPCGAELSCELTVESAVTITARFRRASEERHSLVVNFAGDGRGSVTVGRTECRATCERTFDAGRVVELVARAEAGSSFERWSPPCGSGNHCSIAMTQDRTLSAIFSARPVAVVQVSVDSDGPGSVESTPSGISCGTDCSGTFAVGKNVTLTAVADGGAVFDGWGPGCRAEGTKCIVTVAKPVTIQANFSKRTDTTPGETTVLTVERHGSGSGSITVDTADDDPRACDPPCEVDVARGTSVRVSATPADGSRFDGWSASSCGTSSSCSLKLDGPTTLIATFVRQATLTVDLTGAGAGSVRGDGIDCPGTSCTVTVDQGARVALDATAATGSAFVAWTAPQCTGGQSCTVEMSRDQTIRARFEPLDTFQVRILGRAGTITSPQATISCVRFLCTGQAPRGTRVRLDAHPPAGALFTGWQRTLGCRSSVVPGELPPCTVTLNGPRTVEASFATAVPLTVTVSRGDLGSVVLERLDKACTTTCTYQVPQGMSVVLTAKPGPNGHVWGGACARVRGNDCTLTITARTSVRISFYEPPG
jgi:Divergent InlB B-repeat domain